MAFVFPAIAAADDHAQHAEAGWFAMVGSHCRAPPNGTFVFLAVRTEFGALCALVPAGADLALGALPISQVYRSMVSPNEYNALPDIIKTSMATLEVSDLDHNAIILITTFDGEIGNLLDRRRHQRLCSAMLARRHLDMARSHITRNIQQYRDQARQNDAQKRALSEQRAKQILASAMTPAQMQAASQALAIVNQSLLVAPTAARPCLAWHCPHYGTMTCPYHS